MRDSDIPNALRLFASRQNVKAEIHRLVDAHGIAFVASAAYEYAKRKERDAWETYRKQRDEAMKAAGILDALPGQDTP